ncbi:uncharacterized protein CTHT_0051950 [Thermochaetoides thermophila DSM 1495]|uniref:Acyltransferase 3 domain-containing protein n=1 Tax=Chaetomium thermophilum (strain DSM 1495 / CBS 144.50 / IMI 039719) TaxID=759272 RepID=G0SDI9_CHATD|nr:hypothetical protein CTHT_0051950 [Thermochaetoides thermophila DSM 1495]EGS18590.1 hypothetical protein CTHT_0051950 [Thermochaetoides thermophila DSM 1495]
MPLLFLGDRSGSSSGPSETNDANYVASELDRIESQKHERKALLRGSDNHILTGDNDREEVIAQALEPQLQQILRTTRRIMRQIRSLIIRLLIFFIPSFLQDRFTGRHGSSSSSHVNSTNNNLGPTAYLDGIRGVAALFVFFCHLLYTCFEIAPGYGTSGDHYNPLLLPFVRLWFSGPPMVCVFFVVSGYALSLRPLKLLRSKRWGEFAGTMASLAFRRFFRLFLPTAISTLSVVFLVRIGAYEWTRDFAYDEFIMRNVQEIHYDRRPTTREQLVEWAWAMFNFIHIWDWDAFGGSTKIDVHLWTIPVEFRASMMLFMTIIATSRLRTGARFAVVGAIMLFAYRASRWEMMLFYVGMLLAELDLIRGIHDPAPAPAPAPTSLLSSSISLAPTPYPTPNISRAHSPLSFTLKPASSSSVLCLPALKQEEPEHQLKEAEEAKPQPSSPPRRRNPNPYTSFPQSLIWPSISILALYLMSQPDIGSDETPGYETLVHLLIPCWWGIDVSDPDRSDEALHGNCREAARNHYRYLQSLGAALFVAAAARCAWWQRNVFESPVAQYLGRISYAVYLCHGPVMHTLGYAVERWVWRLTGTQTTGRYVGGFVVACGIVVPLVLWVSDVFWRVVDVQCVKFAKWLEGKCTIDEGKK